MIPIDRNLADSFLHNSPALLKQALEAGANPNLRTYNGQQSMLYLAVASDSPYAAEFVAILLQYGAKPAELVAGKTPLMFLQEKSRLKISFAQNPVTLKMQRLLTVGWQQVAREDAIQKETEDRIAREREKQAQQAALAKQQELERQRAAQEKARLEAEKIAREKQEAMLAVQKAEAARLAEINRATQIQQQLAFFNQEQIPRSQIIAQEYETIKAVAVTFFKLKNELRKGSLESDYQNQTQAIINEELQKRIMIVSDEFTSSAKFF